MRALVREIPASFTRALAMTAPPTPIDVALAREHHGVYQRVLAACGAEITVVAADEACPDCVFVEDTAVIADGLALITNPGAESRRAEVPAITAALARRCEVVHMDASATLDGGDVMRVGRVLYVGRSARTSDAGIAMLERTFGRRGFRVVALALPPGVLHLKCVVSPLTDDTILLAEDSISADHFAGLHVLTTPETYAANAVAIGPNVIVAKEFPRTREILTGEGFRVHAVPTSEVQKADGSLTCQSLIY